MIVLKVYPKNIYKSLKTKGHISYIFQHLSQFVPDPLNWTMIDWVSIVRHSRRRFSVLSFAGGGRQRRGGNFFNVPKSHHHNKLPLNQGNACDSAIQNDERISSTCCFSNVRKSLFFIILFSFYFCLFFYAYLPTFSPGKIKNDCFVFLCSFFECLFAK